MRYAICNETFEGWEHARVCATAAELGYTGLEIAPFTLAPRITEVTAQQRRDLRSGAEKAGIPIIGLHWLLAKTEGLQLTSKDPDVRRRTADYIVELARCCRDLGGSLMVFGSPAQRRIPAGASREQATDWAIDTFQRVIPALTETGVTICLEPLSPPEADFLNTASEGVAMLRRLDSPRFALHLDVKAMSTDEASAPELVRRHHKDMKHFHANDPNKRGPGFGATNFVPIFKALRDVDYQGWVSVEVFDYTPDPVTIARESIRYMRECVAKVG
ncbi:MAG: sugar phosphate isomerase/epimerase family protein [Gemmataceae bacterium]